IVLFGRSIALFNGRLTHIQFIGRDFPSIRGVIGVVGNVKINQKKRLIFVSLCQVYICELKCELSFTFLRKITTLAQNNILNEVWMWMNKLSLITDCFQSLYNCKLSLLNIQIWFFVQIAMASLSISCNTAPCMPWYGQKEIDYEAVEEYYSTSKKMKHYNLQVL
ncbi:hypothetical protein ACJX0J_037630, partial [Zea mays]